MPSLSELEDEFNQLASLPAVFTAIMDGSPAYSERDETMLVSSSALQMNMPEGWSLAERFLALESEHRNLFSVSTFQISVPFPSYTSFKVFPMLLNVLLVSRFNSRWNFDGFAFRRSIFCKIE